MSTQRSKALRVAIGTLLFMLLGPIVWALHFGATYAVQAVTCAVAPSENTTFEWMMGIATLVAAIAVTSALFWPEAFARLSGANSWAMTESRFFVRVMRMLSLLSLFALFALVIVVAMLAPCATLR